LARGALESKKRNGGEQSAEKRSELGQFSNQALVILTDMTFGKESIHFPGSPTGLSISTTGWKAMRRIRFWSLSTYWSPGRGVGPWVSAAAEEATSPGSKETAP